MAIYADFLIYNTHTSIYTGRYIPELTELIHDRNKDPSLYIDLKGILVC